MDKTIRLFKDGIHNKFSDEIIPESASQSSKNWITKDGQIELTRGRQLLGAEGTTGYIQGLHWAYKTDGTKLLYRKINTKVQYWTGTTWTDVLTGLTNGEDMSFSNTSSLSGVFVYLSSHDGLWKINTANPTTVIDLYDAAVNDKGRIMIDKGRLIMWNCNNASKTTLKLSWIDGQDNYTTVSDEAVAGAGSTFVGVLAFKAGDAQRNCFAVAFDGITGGTQELFVDNKDGTMTSNKGGTGTINYATGAYSVAFSASATPVVVDYQWEDSTDNGLADFTFSATRVSGEGNQITQDIGGDKILAVKPGQDGAYYSLKENSAYRLSIAAEDDTFDNNVYRADLGIPTYGASTSTSKGIVFINTANPDNPEMTILQRNQLGDNIEPVVLFPQFDFSNYSYTDCFIDTFDKYVLVSCKSINKDYNDTILLCDMADKTVDVINYDARMFAKDEGVLYAGSDLTYSVYKTLIGYDDEGYAISNYWIGKGETHGSEFLKKFKSLRLQGLISRDQCYDVYISYDNGSFALAGTIEGTGDYVDTMSEQVIGQNMIGEYEIGGDNTVVVYPYFAEIKVSSQKFRKRTIKFVATGIGYASIKYQVEHNLLVFENRMPKLYRTKP